MIRRFLEWRVANNVDEVRTDIVQRGMNSPYKFPSGKKILKLIPQLVISTNVMDRTGAPVSVETYDFRCLRPVHRPLFEHIVCWRF
jgi:hypothetical protein